MRVTHGYRSLREGTGAPVITLGNFDGVHLGHRAILGRARELAERLGAPWAVYTFRPHPQIALKPERGLSLLLTYDEKLEALEQLGVPWTIEEPFSREFSTISASEFFEKVLLGVLRARAIVVGHDFGFGCGREGQIPALREWCERAGVALEVVEALRVDGSFSGDGAPVSSSRIRQALVEGRVEEAAKWLGGEFFYRGPVLKGDSRGKGLGFPTANLAPSEGKILLKRGVYATRTCWDGREFVSVSNLGVRPTFQKTSAGQGEAGELTPVLETHVIGESLDLYGEEIEVRFLRRIRDETKFPNVDALREQIARDIEEAQGNLGNG